MEQAPPEPSDAELAVGIARGAADAEAQFYQRFGGRVLYLAQRELHSRDLAEDARSETFLRVLAALRQGRLQKPEAIASFVLQATRNVVHEMRRKQRVGSPIEGEAERVASAPPDEVDPAVIAAVRETIADLTPRDRAFLKLYYYDELSKDEIARRLGIDAERVRLVKSRALQRFRRAYGERE